VVKPPQADSHTAQLKQWDKEHVWHAFTQMQDYVPLVIERAHGCTLVDVDGKVYLDGVSSLWCNLHGHHHPRLNAALREQLQKVAHVTMLGMSTPATILLSRRLTELAPPGLSHVFYSGDGSSAVEAALKMAFQYWQQTDKPQRHKTTFVAFDDAYHGDTLGSASVGGLEKFHQIFRPLLFDTIRLPVPRSYPRPADARAPMTLDQVCTAYLRSLEEVLVERHHEIAAVIVEPLVQAAAGMVMHPPGFLRGVRQLTKRFDVLMIADEIAAAFGRTGKMFACQHEDVVPDLLCLGKGLTAGYLAMSATLTTDEIYKCFLGDEQRKFYHGNTFAGNALASAVALASLDIFEEERVLDSVATKAARLQQHLERLSGLAPVADARSRGLMGAVELHVTKRLHISAAEVCQFCLDHGVWLRPLDNVIVIMPPLAIALEELDRICEVLEQGIRRLISPSA